MAFGASTFQIGMVNSLKFFGQLFSQFFGLYYLNFFKSKKKAQIFAMFLSGWTMVALGIVAIFDISHWFLIVATVVFMSGFLGRSSYLCWFSWMSSIAPVGQRNYFFGTRKYFAKIFGIVGFLIAFFVLKLDYPILILLGVLYFAAYFFDLLEIGTYVFHLDRKREVLTENHIFKRMKAPLLDSCFTSFLTWFNLLDVALLLNVLYLEYFMINSLELSYYWVPISLIIFSLSVAAASYFFRNIFSEMKYKEKAIFSSALILISSFVWLFANSLALLLIVLVLTGFSRGVLDLVDRVEKISFSQNKDDEAYYAFSNFFQTMVAALFMAFVGFFQKIGFDISFVFYVTMFFFGDQLLVC